MVVVSCPCGATYSYLNRPDRVAHEVWLGVHEAHGLYRTEQGD